MKYKYTITKHFIDDNKDIKIKNETISCIESRLSEIRPVEIENRERWNDRSDISGVIIPCSFKRINHVNTNQCKGFSLRCIINRKLDNNHHLVFTTFAYALAYCEFMHLSDADYKNLSIATKETHHLESNI